MVTEWNGDPELAEKFNDYEGSTELLTGYPTLFAELGLGTDSVRTVLDYGCGPGKAASHVVQHFDVDVLAADISRDMLRIACRDNRHPRIHYTLLTAPRLPHIPDGSVDAAMSCFVFINIPDLDEIRSITAEIHRTLRPGGRFVIMDTNPDATGVDFPSFTTGDENHKYRTGELRYVLLREEGRSLELIDFHWPKDTYIDVLTKAGFQSIAIHTPELIVNDSESAEQGGVTASPGPLIIITGTKP